jgi:hypothetical protein
MLGIALMSGNFTVLRDARKPATGWRVIIKDIQRMFTGVKTVSARLDLAGLFVCGPYLELIAATLEVCVEALEADDGASVLAHGVTVARR